MKKQIIILIITLALLTAGCAGIGSSPTKTVKNFASEYSQENYDICYGMMSTDYKEDTSLSDFVDICKDVNPDKYEFIEVTNEYVDGNIAVVDALVNESSVSVKFSLEKFIEVEPEYNEVTKDLDLIKQEDEWKFTEFPYALT